MGAPKKPFAVPAARGLEIIRTAVASGSYDDGGTGGGRKSAQTANAHGYLDRDLKTASIWYPTEKARAMLAWVDQQSDNAPSAAARQVPIAVERASHWLIETLSQANALFDAGDFAKAQVLADGAYEQAQAEARFSAKYDAAKSLVPKFRKLQGDALLLETRCQIIVAEAYDAAQASGEAAKRGRPKNVPDQNIFTAEEAGLSRKEIMHARRLAEAERDAPGIVERAIAARLAAGLEPSRNNLRASIGTKTATKEERGDNLYETPDVAVLTLMALEDFSPVIWEPACGKGAILHVLEAAGHDVIIGDLVDYGTVTKDGECQDVGDFLDTVSSEWPAGKPDIVTNPPYGAVLNAFVAHALRIHRPQKMALLLNANFWFGFEDEDREYALQENPPARKLSFKRRLPMMHRDGWTGPKASSSMNTAWFIWELQPDGTYGNQTIDIRVDWKDYVTSAVAEAAEAAESEAA